ncbi:MAG: HNH endonuclease, partial [Myxococcota bacterium]
AAYLRIHAARLTRRFPKALDGLAAGRLHLTALKLVGPHLTEENHVRVLECVSGKSRRAIEVELARLFPREDAPSRLRKLPAVRAEDREAREHPTGCGLFGDSSAPVGQPTAPARVSEGSRSEPSPEPVPAFERHRASDVSRCTALSESRYRLQVTLPEHTRAKLDAARELLRHQVPDGDLASVLDHALDALIEARMKRKFAKTSRPRREIFRHSPASSVAESQPKPVSERPSVSAVTSSSSRSDDSKQPSAQSSPHPRSRSRHIPNAIKRAVVERDGMRCSFVDEEGRRCTATSPLEFHHHDPFAKGGDHSVENVSLLCRAHNGHAARRDYGRMMERYRKPADGVRERRARYRVAS